MKRNVFELLDKDEIVKLKLIEDEAGNDLPESISLDAIKGKVYRDTGLTPTKRKRQRVFKITAIVACLAILITGILVFAPLKRFPKETHTVEQMAQKFDIEKIVWRENTDGDTIPDSGLTGTLVGSKDDIFSITDKDPPENGVFITRSLGEALQENGLFDYYAICLRHRSGKILSTNCSEYGYYTVEHNGNIIMIMTGLEFMKFSFGREGMLSDQELVNLVFDIVPASYMGF